MIFYVMCVSARDSCSVIKSKFSYARVPIRNTVETAGTSLRLLLKAETSQILANFDLTQLFSVSLNSIVKTESMSAKLAQFLAQFNPSLQ